MKDLISQCAPTLSPKTVKERVEVLRKIFWRGIHEHGTVEVDSEIEKCKIGYYRIKVAPKGDSWFGTS